MKSSVLENGRERKSRTFFSATAAGRSLETRAKINRNFRGPGIIRAKKTNRPIRPPPEVSQIRNASNRLNSEKMKKSTPNLSKKQNSELLLRKKLNQEKDKNCKNSKNPHNSAAAVSFRTDCFLFSDKF